MADADAVRKDLDLNMKNCKRYGIGGIMTGQMGPGGVIGVDAPTAGEQDEYAALGDLSSLLGKSAAPKRKTDWGQAAQYGMMGALGGMAGGAKMAAVTPFIALLMEALKKKGSGGLAGLFGGGNARTPKFMSGSGSGTDPMGSGE